MLPVSIGRAALPHVLLPELPSLHHELSSSHHDVSSSDAGCIDGRAAHLSAVFVLLTRGRMSFAISRPPNFRNFSEFSEVLRR